MKLKTKRERIRSNVDMTPMIDIVFQLILFFLALASSTKRHHQQSCGGKGSDGNKMEIHENVELFEFKKINKSC